VNLTRKHHAPPFFGRAALFVVALSLMMTLGCGDDDDDGAGFTGDIGNECSLTCFDEWCRNDDHARCYSQWCVGTPDDTYCSVVCDVDPQCPVGFVCTEECGVQVAKNPLCVRENDFELLQDLGFCPK